MPRLLGSSFESSITMFMKPRAPAPAASARRLPAAVACAAAVRSNCFALLICRCGRRQRDWEGSLRMTSNASKALVGLLESTLRPFDNISLALSQPILVARCQAGVRPLPRL